MRTLNLPWRVRDRASGIEFILIPPGSAFWTPTHLEKGLLIRGPRRRVRVEEPFYFARLPLSQPEFARLVAAADLGDKPLAESRGTPDFIERVLHGADLSSPGIDRRRYLDALGIWGDVDAFAVVAGAFAKAAPKDSRVAGRTPGDAMVLCIEHADGGAALVTVQPIRKF